MVTELLSEILKEPKICILAPAGCGKTEMIVDAVQFLESKQLILTHTHAGVDSLKRRFKRKNISSHLYEVDTIASFVRRLVSSYPKISDIQSSQTEDPDWSILYPAMLRLISSKAVRRIIKASYAGVFVDEYQDCSMQQHEIITAISEILPCRVLGDPLQGIFCFGSEHMIDWNRHVLPVFPKQIELNDPWRWQLHNPELGIWLLGVRQAIISKQPVDLRGCPASVAWHKKNINPAEFLTSCKTAAGKDGNILIIGGVVANQCHSLAKFLQGIYKSMETIEAPDLFNWTVEITSHTGIERVDVIIGFITVCISHAIDILRPIGNAIHSGRETKITMQYPSLVASLKSISLNDDIEEIRVVLREAEKIFGRKKIYRTELWDAMRAAVDHHIESKTNSLSESAVFVRNQTRIMGRWIYSRTISRTVLIKGLEFQHVLIKNADELDAKNLYVALTRATDTLNVWSDSPVLHPKY